MNILDRYLVRNIFAAVAMVMAALLILQTAVDEGLGACFFGIPGEHTDAFRQAFGIPDDQDAIIERFTRRFRLADADDNGRVTLDEYMAFCTNVVAAADSNQDGMVTREEFIAASSGGAAE